MRFSRLVKKVVKECRGRKERTKLLSALRRASISLCEGDRSVRHDPVWGMFGVEGLALAVECNHLTHNPSSKIRLLNREVRWTAPKLRLLPGVLEACHTMVTKLEPVKLTAPKSRRTATATVKYTVEYRGGKAVAYVWEAEIKSPLFGKDSPDRIVVHRPSVIYLGTNGAALEEWLAQQYRVFYGKCLDVFARVVSGLETKRSAPDGLKVSVKGKTVR